MATHPSDGSSPSPPSEALSVTPPPPSFKGRLELSNFMFAGLGAEGGVSSAGTRRSPRLSPPLRPASASLSPAPNPSSSRPSPSPLKRKAITSDDDSATTQPARGTSRTLQRSKSRTKTSPSRHAPPSKYAHLPLLPDAITPHLLVLMIGLNPGVETARSQHAYAHPSKVLPVPPPPPFPKHRTNTPLANLFWRLLHSSGLTDRLLPPTEDRQLPSLFSIGFTNIVSRPTRNGAELSKSEMDAGVDILESKVRQFRPEVCCIVGKSIWESIWRVRHGRGIKKEEFKYGWQDEGENMGVVGEEGQREDEKEGGVEYGDGVWEGARVFVTTSTSGLAATPPLAEKQRIWRELGEWAEQRREERRAEGVAQP